MRGEKLLKWSTLFILVIGILFTSFVIWFIHSLDVENIRQNENSICEELSRVVSNTFRLKINENVLSDVIELFEGNITRAEFNKASDHLSRSDFGPVSIGWAPKVEPNDREELERFGNTQYPERLYEVKTIDASLNIIPKPVDNDTMWPMLYTNPLSDRFLGLDFNVIWRDQLNTMSSSRQTVLTPGFSMNALGGIGFFIGESYSEFDEGREDISFMTFSPVISKDLSILGFTGKLILPRGIILDTLTPLSSDVNNVEFSFFTKKNDILLAVMDLNTPVDEFAAFTIEDTNNRGENFYRTSTYVYDRDFIFLMSSDTKPEVTQYILVGSVGIISIILLCFMNNRQINVSNKNKQMAIDAKNANKSKSVFLAEMSHELRTPLNGIVGTIELLKDYDIDKDVVKHLVDIESCSEMLLLNISEILDITKIETGNLTLNHEKANLVDFILSISRIMKQAYKCPKNAKNVQFIINIDKNVPNSTVVGDTTKLRQIIMNLVSNAFKFTDVGSVKMNVHCTTRKNTGETYISKNYENLIYLSIDVKDTGIGMNGDKVEKLFQPFTQVHTNRSDAGGTGLGLVITRSFCNAMSGSITVDSSVGTGSTFKSVMVFGHSHTANHAKNNIIKTFDLGNNTRSRIGTSPNTSILSDSMHKRDWILLVDDVEINRKIAQKLIAKLNVNVEVASDGAQTVEMCSIREYALIFMDYYMPGMNGADTTRLIRSGFCNRNTPIIGLTASNTPEILSDMHDSGMNSTLFKPITLEIFRKSYEEHRVPGNHPSL